MKPLETIFWASVVAAVAITVEPMIPAWLYAGVFGLWFGAAMYLALTHDFGTRSW